MSITKGCWKIGNKELNEVDEIMTTSDHRPSEVVRQEYYVLAGMEPHISSLPWAEDLSPEQKRKIEFG